MSILKPFLLIAVVLAVMENPHLLSETYEAFTGAFAEDTPTNADRDLLAAVCPLVDQITSTDPQASTQARRDLRRIARSADSRTPTATRILHALPAATRHGPQADAARLLLRHECRALHG